MSRLAGKVAIITGGARGMGACEAELFAAEGCKVMIGDVLDEEGEAVAATLGSSGRYRHLDVASETDWDGLVRETLDAYGGRIDVLVNNAGIYRGMPLGETSLETFRQLIDVNQIGPFLGMKAVAPTMQAQRSGSIINVSSGAGHKGLPNNAAYSATKFAVRGLTKSMARELGPSGIRVNVLVPGLTDTPLIAHTPQSHKDNITETFCIQRLGQPEDVARMALFLASDDSAYCTGADFLVEGGALV